MVLIVKMRLMGSRGRIEACTSLAKRFNLSVDRCNKVVGFFDGHTKQCGKKLKVFFHRKVRVKREASGHVPHCGAYVEVVLDDVASIDCRATFVGCEERCEQSEQSRLACSIGSDKTEQFSSLDIERYIVESLCLAVALG